MIHTKYTLLKHPFIKIYDKEKFDMPAEYIHIEENIYNTYIQTIFLILT